jgi:DNA-binding transcriptional regulator YhcF (GntR family)
MPTEATLPKQIHLDAHAGVPLHVQFGQVMRELLREEVFPPGSRMPQVRDFCRELKLSTGTVMRTMLDLKREGLIVSRQGRGTFAAERAAPATEVLLWESHQGHGLIARPSGFHQQILDGLRDGFSEPNRRFVLTHYDQTSLSSREVLGMLRLRGADSLVVYRWRSDNDEGIRAAAAEVPVVSLFARLKTPGVDSVIPDVRPVLRQWLQERIAAGRRDFAFVCGASLTEDPDSPYRGMQDAMQEYLPSAGANVTLSLLSSKQPVADRNAVAAATADLPPGCVIVAGTPHTAEATGRTGPDVVAYTESHQSLETYGGRMTVLYMGLEAVASAAVPLLRERRGALRKPSRTLRVEPSLWCPAQAAAAGTYMPGAPARTPDGEGAPPAG